MVQVNRNNIIFSKNSLINLKQFITLFVRPKTQIYPHQQIILQQINKTITCVTSISSSNNKNWLQISIFQRIFFFGMCENLCPKRITL